MKEGKKLEIECFSKISNSLYIFYGNFSSICYSFSTYVKFIHFFFSTKLKSIGLKKYNPNILLTALDIFQTLQLFIGYGKKVKSNKIIMHRSCVLFIIHINFSSRLCSYSSVWCGIFAMWLNATVR